MHTPSTRSPAILLALALLAGCSSSSGSSAEVTRDTSLADVAEDTASASDTPAAEDTAAEDTAARDDAPALDAAEDTAAEDTAAEDTSEATPDGCEGYLAPIDAGAMQEPALLEASGLVASRRSPGVLWLHNDSGDDAILYAIATDGRALARLTLPGVEARDFEDIALGPCPEGDAATCLWVADVGNNARTRDDLTLYATPEPEISLTAPPGALVAEQVWSRPIAYPQGEGIDCEAVVVDGEAIYLFEKVDAAQARVFRLAAPWPAGRRVVDEVARFNSPGVPVERGLMITGADLHPGGRRLALRLYTGSFEYRFGEGEGIEALSTIEPLLVAAGPLSEAQGEAIGYDASGLGLWTVSEARDGQPGQPLHFYGCAEP